MQCGWEGWFQVNFALTMLSSPSVTNVLRENVADYGGGKRADITFDRGGVHVVVELKCEISTETSAAFVARAAADYAKLQTCTNAVALRAVAAYVIKSATAAAMTVAKWPRGAPAGTETYPKAQLFYFVF
jgi:hypothetical protein